MNKRYFIRYSYTDGLFGIIRKQETIVLTAKEIAGWIGFSFDEQVKGAIDGNACHITENIKILSIQSI